MWKMLLHVNQNPMMMMNDNVTLIYLQRLVEPPEVRHERLFLVSVGGLIVNLLGIFAFQHGHGHSHGGGDGKSFDLTTGL